MKKTVFAFVVMGLFCFSSCASPSEERVNEQDERVEELEDSAEERADEMEDMEDNRDTTAVIE